MLRWLKQHWKWLITLPFMALGFVALYLFGRQKPDEGASVTPDSAADAAVDEVIAATDERDQAIEKLEIERGEKLAVMSDEQRIEYQEVKKKPVDEVATWIDKL